MCGIAGFLDLERRLDPDAYEKVAGAMADTLAHRGPDDRAVWADRKAGIAFGFRRLSIIDPSPAGRQPMVSAGGGLVMMCNGEIYNFRALREELVASGEAPRNGPQGRPSGGWRGHSDSEVLLAAIERWGFLAALSRLNGMFAIALWDRGARRLFLARDRLGEKPLYYGVLRGTFVFASELKALAAHPSWRGEHDPKALALFLRHSYVPSPFSAFAGIGKLGPGEYLSISQENGQGRPLSYWSAVESAAAASRRPFAGGLGAAVERLEALIDDAVRLRLESDVPLGALLSGGTDSATIVAAMRRLSPVKSFSAGFEEARFDESRHARAVARHLGTEHTSFTVSEADCCASLPLLSEIYDEPFADPSVIPTLALCRLVRSKVWVALSGDGGDELFGGYPRYAAAARKWARNRRAPRALRAAARRLVSSLTGRNARTLRRLRKLAEPWAHESPASLYLDTVSRWREGDGLTPALPAIAPDLVPMTAQPSLEQSFMLLDAVTYLPDDLLVKIDRASMAFGLEVRAPLLDHRIAEFAWSLPPELAIAGGAKRVLREALYRRVPRMLVERPKQGFEPPLERWLREGLRDWADDLFSPAFLRRQGFLSAEVVAQRWSEHRSGRRNWAYPLWNVLMLAAWLERVEAARGGHGTSR